MKVPNYIIGAVGVLLVVLAIVIGMKIQGANEDAKAKQQQEQTDRQHSKDVQYYTDQCMSGGRWIC